MHTHLKFTVKYQEVQSFSLLVKVLLFCIIKKMNLLKSNITCLNLSEMLNSIFNLIKMSDFVNFDTLLL